MSPLPGFAASYAATGRAFRWVGAIVSHDFHRGLTWFALAGLIRKERCIIAAVGEESMDRMDFMDRVDEVDMKN